jgi:hypothetical protein
MYIYYSSITNYQLIYSSRKRLIDDIIYKNHVKHEPPSSQFIMLRSIRAFFIIGNGISELHLGHFGLFLIINTYDKQPGHPAANGDENSLSSS